MKKKSFLLIVFFVLSVLCCFAKEKASVEKKDGAMFWEITGKDKKGNESKVYILGTFHIADEKLYPVPQFVLDAFDNADVVAGEISSDGWIEFNTLLQNAMMKDMIKDPKKYLNNYLTEEEMATVAEYLGAQANLMYQFKPWVLNQVLSGFVFDDVDLDFQEAYDNYFISRSNEKGIYMEGMDETQVQIDCLAYGNMDYQLTSLKSTIASLGNSDESLDALLELYRAYLSFDEEEMATVYFGELQAEISANKALKGYYDALLKNRNKTWAKKIAKYLSDGGSTFIFAGTGHFIGDDSVFAFMRKNGTLK